MVLNQLGSGYHLGKSTKGTPSAPRMLDGDSLAGVLNFVVDMIRQGFADDFGLVVSEREVLPVEAKEG